MPSCAEGGVLGVLCGIIGSLQVNETLKLILEKGDPLTGRLVLFDALGMKFREMKLHKDKACPICGENPTITELIDYEQFCGILPQEEEPVDSALEIEPAEVKRMMDSGEKFTLIDVRNPSEYGICKIEGSTLIPLDEIEERDPERLNGLGKEDFIVLHCKAGVRSMKALKAMQDMGYHNLKSMRGGITEWSETVDPSVPTY